MRMTPNSQSPKTPLVRRLTLTDFRSYAQADCVIETQLVALMGENGAGKTNILEALSMYSPGRGLRRAELPECARHAGTGGYAVSIQLEMEGVATQLGHGLSPGESDGFALIARQLVQRAPLQITCAFFGSPQRWMDSFPAPLASAVVFWID